MLDNFSYNLQERSLRVKKNWGHGERGEAGPH